MQGDFLVGEWLIQPSLGRATRNGTTVRLRAKVMDLLVFLAERRGEVVAKDALLDGVWGTDALSESALTRSITELRQALRDEAEQPSLIETIPKRGYRIIASVTPVASPLDESAAPRTATVRRTWDRRLVIAIVVLAAAGLVGLAVVPRASTDPPAVVRFLMSPPDGTTYAAFPRAPQPAISPDGRQIAMVGEATAAIRQIWIHALDSIAGRPIAGTEDASLPFWSPDGRWLGFFADGKLKKVRVEGGVPETLWDGGPGAGASWNTQGVVLFAPNFASGLWSISASGGDAVPVTTLEASREETAHRYPQFLPDGRHYLYLVRSNRREHQGIYVGLLGSTERKRLLGVDSNAVFAPTGHLLFVRERALMAQRFDVHALELTGEPVRLATGMMPAPSLRLAPFSVSHGVLAYRTGGMHKSRLVWVDRSGGRVEALGEPARYIAPALSPDGTRLAVDLLDLERESLDTWIFDLTRGVSARLTFASSLAGSPLWTPDGKSLVFASDRRGAWDLYEAQLNLEAPAGTITDRVLVESATNKYPQAFTPDGQAVIYAEWTEATGYDLWMVHRTGTAPPVPVLRTRFNETQAQLSPDGRWLAYTSDESGRLEVYARAFPVSGETIRISTDGGCQPRWRADGEELFYVHRHDVLSVRLGGHASIEPAVPQRLFEIRTGRNSDTTWDFVVSPDGKRFLVKNLAYEADASPMVIVLNWQSLLQRERRKRSAW